MIAACKERCPVKSGLWSCNRPCEAQPGDPEHFHFVGTSTHTHDWKDSETFDMEP
jgi:hypothetical protein